MMYDGYVYVEGLKVGDYVDTGGIYYGPYNAVTCLAITENSVAIHIKGHNQYWSQSRHYIPAHCIVLKKVKVDGNRWECKKIYERDCGRQSKQVKEEAISIALKEDG